jgi:hypothetical protein
MASAVAAMHPASVRKTRDEKRSNLARQVTALIAQGRRVESQSDYEAVLVAGHNLWESREVVAIDGWGNVHVERLGINKERFAVAFAIALVIVALIVVVALTW